MRALSTSINNVIQFNSNKVPVRFFSTLLSCDGQPGNGDDVNFVSQQIALPVVTINESDVADNNKEFLTLVELNNLRQRFGYKFYRFSWLVSHLSHFKKGTSVFVVTLEPVLDQEELRYAVYRGILVAKTLQFGSISLVLRQSLPSCHVDRTFFLNSSNFVCFFKF